MINVKFFAAFREIAEVQEIKIEHNLDVMDVSDLISTLAEQREQLSFLEDGNVLVAVNQTLCSKDTTINDGDEVAFFPPVTGG